jgi:hypothetical protein
VRVARAASCAVATAAEAVFFLGYWQASCCRGSRIEGGTKIDKRSSDTGVVIVVHVVLWCYFKKPCSTVDEIVVTGEFNLLLPAGVMTEKCCSCSAIIQRVICIQ